MDYSQLSDFEINKLVAQAKRYPLKSTQHFGDAGLSIVMLEHGYPSHFDPCRNPTDAWPIIFSNLISVEPDYEYIDPSEEECFASGLWISEYFDGKNKSLRYADPSPLRAAMIVFLKMQGPNNA